MTSLPSLDSSASVRVPPPPPNTRASAPSGTSKGLGYTRDLLMSLATPKAPTPNRDRVKSISELLRQDSVWQWGLEEDQSDILDGKPVSEALPIPKQAEFMGAPGHGHAADILFNYRSSPGDAAVPILIDFSNPEPFVKVHPHAVSSDMEAKVGKTPAPVKIPSIVTHQTTAATPPWRLGARTPSLSRSSSPTLSDSSCSFRGRASSISSSPLNPFAPPFPLPNTTPRVSVPGPPSVSDRSSTSSTGLPKTLPTSLPKKPEAPLPPIFVKRESAALPQPMALPEIAPMGPAWEGDASLSGNEKRRRASSLVPPPGYSATASEGGKPEKLLQLRQRLRQNSVVLSGNKTRV
ncbi:hypothetical protein DB88DRAFT_471977 [Papiliotrema laurentii]|uniref:Uncharacterized protein n=1 Tax=Papiliotrema laurentii TaxID=5418 RepID=A0AAD9L5Q1_PAPLA|nr:hypothetical protein DB88DRAFT_471977 [Papiliotrema laurentii]